MREIAYRKIEDIRAREAFSELNQEIIKNPFTAGEFKFYELELDQAVTDYEFKHNLGFIPTDLIQTSIIGSAVTWDYDSFDSEKLVLTTAGAVTIRFLAGRFKRT